MSNIIEFGIVTGMKPLTNQLAGTRPSALQSGSLQFGEHGRLQYHRQVNKFPRCIDSACHSHIPAALGSEPL